MLTKKPQERKENFVVGGKRKKKFKKIPEKKKEVSRISASSS